MAKASSSKHILILLAVVFILPVVLAKIALEQDWFNKAVTNKGELLSPVLNVGPLLSEEPKKWRVLYVVPSNCESACKNAVYSIQQINTALGKESDRANATLLVTQKSDAKALDMLGQIGNTEVLNVTNEVVNKVFDPERRAGIFLVDTLNNAMMYYGVPVERDNAIMQSRDVLSDLKKMLKLSRIG